MASLGLSPQTLELSCGGWCPLLSPFRPLEASLRGEAGRTGMSILPMQLRLRDHKVQCEEPESSYVTTPAPSTKMCTLPQIPNAHLPQPPHLLPSVPRSTLGWRNTGDLQTLFGLRPENRHLTQSDPVWEKEAGGRWMGVSYYWYKNHTLGTWTFKQQMFGTKILSMTL